MTPASYRPSGYERQWVVGRLFGGSIYMVGLRQRLNGDRAVDGSISDFADYANFNFFFAPVVGAAFRETSAPSYRQG
jgi:hypothetical protein